MSKPTINRKAILETILVYKSDFSDLYLAHSMYKDAPDCNVGTGRTRREAYDNYLENMEEHLRRSPFKRKRNKAKKQINVYGDTYDKLSSISEKLNTSIEDVVQYLEDFYTRIIRLKFNTLEDIERLEDLVNSFREKIQ
jgi:hypothetical protein